ncbi:MAG: LacI family DNA-binding transcriptional regulator [Acidiferrobacterales bacterium]|nr:LacI family DNA-binding transcriptional regulator [Acidiferrobacterales bacterium]
MKKTRAGATSNDVAALAGVSQSAVSRAFTPGSSISSDKRDKILEAARKLNYIPNSIASSMITKRSNTIAVVLGNIENPFYVHVLKTFIEKLQERGRQTFTFTVEPGSSSDDVITQVLRHQVDGIVLTAAQLSTKTTSLCLERGIPIVLFNRYVPGSDASVVRCDNQQGGRELAETLLDAGARTFAILKGDPMGTTSQDRVKGFSERLIEEGIKRSAIHEIEGQSIYDGAFDAMTHEYGDSIKPLPDAIFGVNDIMAMAAIDALRHRLGKRVPADVMVCGFDDIPEGRRTPYQLTTLRQPIQKMVDETLSLLNLDDDNSSIKQGGADHCIAGRLIKRNTVR